MSCSVCSQNGNSTTGGVLLFERNGFVSAICDECWFSFSLNNPQERCCKNGFQMAALMANIGVESQLYYKTMDVRKPFSENVVEARTKLKYRIQSNPFGEINVN